MPSLVIDVPDQELLDRLVAKWGMSDHGSRSTCPWCGQDCRTAAIVKLAYTFEACECKRAPFKHLIEQLWHRTCMVAANPA